MTKDDLAKVLAAFPDDADIGDITCFTQTDAAGVPTVTRVIASGAGRKVTMTRTPDGTDVKVTKLLPIE